MIEATSNAAVPTDCSGSALNRDASLVRLFFLVLSFCYLFCFRVICQELQCSLCDARFVCPQDSYRGDMCKCVPRV